MPARLHTADVRPFETLSHVGIAITIVEPSRKQQHIGLLHRNESSGELFILHLAWHNQLRNSVPKKSYGWIDPSIHPARARQAAARCRQVHRSNIRGIP